jgi:Protein of unknown function DUF262/HNH endonuclease
MPTHFANLDALLPRDDFEVISDAPQERSQLTPSIRITDLEQGAFLYPLLRKPEFQRETASWDPAKVVDLIQSFVEGDLIPSLIFWRAADGNNFVIDGAHRLSALIAWVHDDYGNGSISVPFFGAFIPPEQEKAAEQTRKLVKDRIGSYAELKVLAQHPDNTAFPERLRYTKNLGVRVIDLQWVLGGASKAENSYFKINQKATLINPTELAMIQERHKPNALATRALIHAGTGHRYWSAFSQGVQGEIEAIGREVYDVFFKPALEEPIKTLDLPVGGRGYSADSIKMIFDLVNFLNSAGQPANAKGAPKNVPEDDTNGEATLRLLKAVRRASSLIAGTEPQSLGLHPAVYFYGATGRFQPTAFLAAVAFIRELEVKKRLLEFTEARFRFEEFLLKYRHFPNLIARHLGAAQRGLQSTMTMYRTMLAEITAGTSDEDIVTKLRAEPQLSFLQVITAEDRIHHRNFSTETKSAAYLGEALAKELRCAICKARLHFKSISVDHVVRKDDGGPGTPDNAQLAHPYCNTGYKEAMTARSRKASGNLP